MEPVEPSRRITSLDAVRGVALGGILIVNFYHFFHPWNVPAVNTDTSQADRAARFLIDFLFDSKFYPIFASLFGAGLFLQMRRAGAVASCVGRRLALLAVFGLAHGVLLWTGDILLVYAVAGLVLLLGVLRNSAALEGDGRATLYWALGLMAAPTLSVAIGVGVSALAHATPAMRAEAAGMDRDLTRALREGEADAAEEVRIYRGGTYFEVTGLRLRRYLETVSRAGAATLPMTIGLFLLGWRAARKDWFEDAAAHRRLIAWALPIGLALSLFAAVAGFDAHHLSAGPLDGWFLAQFAAHEAGGVVLSQGYVAGFLLLFSRRQRVQAALAATGRMALTNYLLQSAIVTTVAYGYGGGLYGTVGTAVGVGCAGLLYGVQVGWSGWWLRRFRFGPAEWLWRSWTHGRPQAIRR